MVEVDADNALARAVVWDIISGTDGVTDLVDLSAIGAETLKTFLLPDAPKRTGGRRKHADA